MYRLLVLDISYSLEAIRARKLEGSVTCRDLNGFFDHVWSVHPFASLVTSRDWSNRYCQHKIYKLTPSHTFIEGKVGRFQVLHFIYPLNFLISQLCIFFYLKRLISREKISVIRVGDPLYLGIFGWLLSRSCGIPFVVRVGANYDKIFETTGEPLQKRFFFSRKFEKLVEQFIFLRADLVAGANQDNLNYALANGARPEYSTLFRYGNLIDNRHFIHPSERFGGHRLLRELGVKAQGFILYIGRLESVKHPDHVVRVLSEVRKRGHDVKAVLVGDGHLKSKLHELALDLRVEREVIFAGNRDQHWLSLIIPLAAGVISPHTGRSLTEAALGGAPIVAYDVDWQAELIQTGITGELVPHCDLVGMVDSVERILCNPKYATLIGNSVRIRISEMMDPERLNSHEREAYTCLLNRTKLSVP